MERKRGGRPKGRYKTSRLEVMLSPEMKEEFKIITEANGTNPSVKVCELIAQYITENRKGGENNAQ